VRGTVSVSAGVEARDLRGRGGVADLVAQPGQEVLTAEPKAGADLERGHGPSRDEAPELRGAHTEELSRLGGREDCRIGALVLHGISFVAPWRTVRYDTSALGRARGGELLYHKGPKMTQNHEREAESAATWEAVGTLVPWDSNPRLNDRAIEKVAASIKRFGFGAPIVARSEDRMVIAGHTRLKAAIHLGLDRVPVRFVDLDPADARMLALADNRTGEEAEWNIGALPSILAGFAQADLALADLGFDPSELDAIMGRMENIDDVPPADFSEFEGDDVETEHQCPKCGYEWR